MIIMKRMVFSLGNEYSMLCGHRMGAATFIEELGPRWVCKVAGRLVRGAAPLHSRTSVAEIDTRFADFCKCITQFGKIRSVAGCPWGRMGYPGPSQAFVFYYFFVSTTCVACSVALCSVTENPNAGRSMPLRSASP